MEERKVKNVYLSLKVTGREAEAMQEAIKVRALLEKSQVNWNVMTPFQMLDAFRVARDHKDDKPEIEAQLRRHGVDSLWVECMEACIRGMLLCDMVVMVGDWRDSHGARIEKFVAEELGMEVMEWYDDKLHYMVDDE